MALLTPAAANSTQLSGIPFRVSVARMNYSIAHSLPYPSFGLYLTYPSTTFRL